MHSAPSLRRRLHRVGVHGHAAKNPVHSVLFLILAFVNASGLFVLMGAEFLAMILVVVYVGAVAVLFLFVVMMLDVDFAEFRQGSLQYLPIGALVGLILLAELLLVVVRWTIAPGYGADHHGADPADRQHHQYRGARAGALHALHLLFPGLRRRAAGRHDRGDRADAAPQAERQAAEHCSSRSPAPRRPRWTIVKVRPGQGLS